MPGAHSTMSRCPYYTQRLIGDIKLFYRRLLVRGGQLPDAQLISTSALALHSPSLYMTWSSLGVVSSVTRILVEYGVRGS